MKRYTEEFKQEAVRLAGVGDRTLGELAKDLGISKHTLFFWTKEWRKRNVQGNASNKAGRNSERYAGDGSHSRPSPRLTPDQEEIRRLKRELAVVIEEREILKKATAFFAKESK